MGRTLKRVPLDFDYPLDKVWTGYFMNYIPGTCMSTTKNGNRYCDQCRKFAELKGIRLHDYGCPDYDNYFSEIQKKLRELCEPPKGDGYQLWETTSEGSPISPVFGTLDELCEWCEENATTFGDFKASKEEWKKMLNNDLVVAKSGMAVFI